MDFQIQTGDAIRMFRAKKRLSQRKLALRSGLSQECISKIERGNGNITMHTLIAIAAAFDVSPAELFRESVKGENRGIGVMADELAHHATA